MFHKLISYAGPLILAGALLVLTPGPGEAAGHGGGGHGGGGHFGGGHFGGAHFGGAHFGGGHFGGAHVGGFHGGFYSHPYAHFGYRHYGSWGYYPYYDGYYNDFYYPYVWLGSGGDPGYDDYPYYGDQSLSSRDSYAPFTPPAGSSLSFYPPPAATQQPNTDAHVSVDVPADAQVWFDGQPTRSTGPTRLFHSPPLTPGKNYRYEIRARWNENGREVTQTQQVEVTAGARVTVDFPARKAS
jgi:uncharacterized protein (TIGR03000 family)